MLSLPDFKEKQILFIKTDNNSSNKIKIHNDNLIYTRDDKIVDQISCHKLFSVFIIGNISITSELIKKALKAGISLFLLKNNFECYANINSSNIGNYLLRINQYTSNGDLQLTISKFIVKNKIDNQIRLLNSKGRLINKTFYRKLKSQINNAKNLEYLRGIEGNFSKLFFAKYFHSIGWYSRLPRVKQDIPNFLLDMGYTMLFNFIDSLLNLFGFDVYKGFYHQLFFQRKSLSCDIIEPFRPIIDREILKMYNLKILNEKDFKFIKNKIHINYDKSVKYAEIFFNCIMKNKEEIYNYIRDFYRYIMNCKKYKPPYFKISR